MVLQEMSFLAPPARLPCCERAFVQRNFIDCASQHWLLVAGRCVASSVGVRARRAVHTLCLYHTAVHECRVLSWLAHELQRLCRACGVCVCVLRHIGPNRTRRALLLVSAALVVFHPVPRCARLGVLLLAPRHSIGDCFVSLIRTRRTQTIRRSAGWDRHVLPWTTFRHRVGQTPCVGFVGTRLAQPTHTVTAIAHKLSELRRASVASKIRVQGCHSILI